VKYARLMPRRHPQSRRLESSVCRSVGMSNANVFAICEAYFDPHSRHPAIGRGVARAKVVMQAGLQVEADGIPFVQHANIVGWFDDPSRDDSEMKHHWMNLAKRMAPEFRYIER
jgi:hypothetical protein